MSQRYFLTTESAYEALRLALDADLGYPTSAATSIFTPALEAPRDSLRRIVLAVDDSLPHYAEIIAKVEPLLASASAQELTEAEYLAFLVCVSEGGGVPLAHAASHAAGGADELFDQALNTASSVAFESVTAGTVTISGSGPGNQLIIESGSTVFFNSFFAGSLLSLDGNGAVVQLSIGTAGQHLRVNSGATGVEWVTLGTAAAASTSDFAAASHNHAASDINSGVLATARLASSGTASATTFLRGDQTWATAGSTNASDLTSGTLADARLSTNAQAAINLYLWSSFR